MATDIRLDEGPAEGQITVDTNVLKVTGSDVMLDSPTRREGQAGSFRRALVHSAGDSLTVNFNNDYRGGVHINGARLHLRNQGPDALSKDGSAGDLVLVHVNPHRDPHTGVMTAGSTKLYLCLGRSPYVALPNQPAQWVPISTGEPVAGI